MLTHRHRREPTIALINIVFLMLVFFMVAGTLRTPQHGEVSLVQTAELEGQAPRYVLVVHADGAMWFEGEHVTHLAAFYGNLPDPARVRVMPDRALPAAELIRIGAQLKSLGAERVLIVTERSLP